MAKPWNDLLTESRSNTIFLTWEWLYTWAECFLGSDRRLFILLVYKDSELIGVAPWSIRFFRYFGFTMKNIEFLGIPETGSDYLDVFTKVGKEKEVANQIYRFLLESASLWDGISLEDIVSDSLFLLHFINRFEEEGKYTELASGAYCPWAALPSTFDLFRVRLSSNRREQFSRHLRLLRQGGKGTLRTYPSREAGSALKEFQRIYELRWGESDGLFHFLEKFIARSEGKSAVQIDFLSAGVRDIAGLFHLRYGKILSMYLMGVDHSFDKSISIGNVLVGLAIEKAITEGFSRYDFLRGDEDYKFHWSDGGKRAVHLYYYGKKTGPFLLATGKFLKSAGKILLR